MEVTLGIGIHIAEGALDLRHYRVVGAVDAVGDRAVAGGASVGVEVVLSVADIAGGWNCAGCAEGSGAVGVGLGMVGRGLAVGEAEQEDQCDKYLRVHIRIIQQIRDYGSIAYLDILLDK